MATRPEPGPQPEPGHASFPGVLIASVGSDGDTAVIHLAGSLRSATAPTLREEVDGVLDQRPATVVLDLTDITADDELGLWVLPAMAGDAARHGINLIVTAPHRALRVRLRRLGGHHLQITEAVPALDPGPPARTATTGR
jgi:anti-anti-sigma factor